MEQEIIWKVCLIFVSLPIIFWYLSQERGDSIKENSVKVHVCRLVLFFLDVYTSIYVYIHIANFDSGYSPAHLCIYYEQIYF